MTKIDNVLADTILRGGGTFKPTLEPFDAEFGYLVGAVRGTYALVPLDDIPDNFDGAILSVQVGYPGHLIGTWVHDGNIHIDPVEWFATRNEAEAAAKSRDQKAFWDISNSREVVP